MSRRRSASRPRVEVMDGRRLLATFRVTSTADGGPETLRQAILDANATPGADAITFRFPGEGNIRLDLAWPLPAITDTVAIDGTPLVGDEDGRPGGAFVGLAAPGRSSLRYRDSDGDRVTLRVSGDGLLLMTRVPATATPTVSIEDLAAGGRLLSLTGSVRRSPRGDGRAVIASLGGDFVDNRLSTPPFTVLSG